MYKEIINKYEKFSDSLVSELIYREIDNSKSIDVIINCMNSHNDYLYETIKIYFKNVISFNFNENENQSSTFINAAFIENNKGVIVFDFFPLIYENNILKENENSDFKIKCKSISYKKIR